MPKLPWTRALAVATLVAPLTLPLAGCHFFSPSADEEPVPACTMPEPVDIAASEIGGDGMVLASPADEGSAPKAAKRGCGP